MINIKNKEERTSGDVQRDMEITYRIGTKDDYEEFTPILHQAFVVEQGIPAKIQLVDEKYGPTYYVALADGKITGVIAEWTEDGVHHLGRYAVDPEMRGHGVGKGLMRYCLNDIFDRRNIDHLEMDCRPVSVNILSKMGAVVTGEPVEFFIGTLTPMKLDKADYIR